MKMREIVPTTLITFVIVFLVGVCLTNPNVGITIVVSALFVVCVTMIWALMHDMLFGE